jgi:predicted MPP superfamily phosphohydrolase
VHLGLVVGENRLKRILDQVQKAKPHILVSTGDLVDGLMIDPDLLATMLRTIQTPLGKFAVTGNHEFYAGQHAMDFTQKAGFVILRGQAHTLKNGITIAGIDDPTGRYQTLPDALPEGKLLKEIPENQFVVFLKHQPIVDAKSIGLFDLQLSGHSHQGQIFPFGLLVKLVYKINHGFTQLAQGSSIYVSRGTGTWGPPVRFLAPPEVTLIEIIPKKS